MFKKASLFLLFLLSLITLAGCGILGGNTIDEDYFENYDEINSEKEKVYDNFDLKITDEAEKSAFNVDYLTIGSADLVAGIYIAVINMYNLTPKLVNQDIKKEGDTYTITDENTKVVVRYDSDSKSTQLEMYDNDKLEYLIETTELSNGEYAYLLYSVTEDIKTVSEFRFKDGNGSLAVKENVTSQPASIYKKNTVSSTFAKEGDRVYKLENGNYTFTGTLEHQKTMTDFVIMSGLNSEYLVDSTLTITSMVIKVTYSDATTENVNVTSAMLTSNMPDMSTTGDKSFKLTYQGMEKTFTFKVVSQLKTITDFTLKSGLKTTYKINDPFDVYNIILEVTYNDNSKGDMAVTSAMIVGEVPSTASAGEKELVLKIGTIQKTFNFSVTTGTLLTKEDKLNSSYEKFFQTLYLGTGDAFVPTYLTNFLAQNDKPRNEFFNDFTDDAISQWGAVILSQDAVSAIYASKDGNFETLYETPANEYNKNNYLNYTDGKYNLGLWIKKGLYMYWFEFIIEFNETNDGFKMNVKSGVDENQIDRATLEYVEFEAGKYAMNLYYYDESYDPEDYCVYQSVFTNKTGRIVKNYLVNNLPVSILTQTDFANFAKTGDAFFEMTSNTSATYTKNIKSDAYNFYAQVAYKLNDGEYLDDGSMEDLMFKKIEALDTEYAFNRDYFTLDDYYLGSSIELMRAYEEKEFRDSYDGWEVVISKSGATTTFTLTSEYDEVDTVKITYATNKVKVEYSGGDYNYTAEVVKVNNEYYVQIVNKDSSSYYVVSKAKYIDANNAIFLLSEEEETQPVSIYTTIPTDFLTKGTEKFELKNGVLTISKKYQIYVDPANETDGYYMYTDLTGKLVLPTVSYTGYTFNGWYIDDVLIGKTNVTYTFTEDCTITAQFDEIQ